MTALLTETDRRQTGVVQSSDGGSCRRLSVRCSPVAEPWWLRAGRTPAAVTRRDVVCRKATPKPVGPPRSLRVSEGVDGAGLSLSRAATRGWRPRGVGPLTLVAPTVATSPSGPCAPPTRAQATKCVGATELLRNLVQTVLARRLLWNLVHMATGGGIPSRPTNASRMLRSRRGCTRSRNRSAPTRGRRPPPRSPPASPRA